MKLFKFLALTVVAAVLTCGISSFAAEAKKIVLVAGPPSHGPGAHEFNAGVQLLNKCLANVPNIKSTFYLNGWPKDPHAFDGADAIVLYMDGGPNHPALQGDDLHQ